MPNALIHALSHSRKGKRDGRASKSISVEGAMEVVERGGNHLRLVFADEGGG